MGTWDYIVKLGYVARIEEVWNGDRVWWWRFIWKLYFPLKTRILMWLALDNKLFTWDNVQKRSWVRLNICILCKVNDKLLNH